MFVELDWCYWFFVLFPLLLIDLLSLFIILMAHNFNSVFIIEKSVWHLFEIDSEIWIKTFWRETIASIIFTNFIVLRNLWLRVHEPISMLKLASSYLLFSMQVSRTFCQSLIELTFFAMKYLWHQQTTSLYPSITISLWMFLGAFFLKNWLYTATTDFSCMLSLSLRLIRSVNHMVQFKTYKYGISNDRYWLHRQHSDLHQININHCSITSTRKTVI